MWCVRIRPDEGGRVVIMPCSAGHPKKPCPFGHKGKVTRDSCGRCKHYSPPPRIALTCILWDRDRQVCNLPRSACDSCRFKIERAPGRPAGEGRDFSDPKVKKEYASEWGSKNRGKKYAALQRLLKKDPEYFKKYRAKNRDKIREYSRRWYHENKD